MFDLGFEEIDIADELNTETLSMEKIAELSSFANSIIEAAGVCQADALSLESIMDGSVPFFNDRIIKESFSLLPTRTNMTASLEFIDTSNKYVMGGLVAAGIAIIAKILHWIYKFFTGDDSGAGGGGGGGGAAAAKVESTKTEAEKKAEENAKKASEMNPADVAAAEKKAALDALKEHKVSALMNLIYITNGPGQKLVNAVVDFAGQLPQILHYIRTKAKSFTEGEFLKYEGGTTEVSLHNKSRIADIQALSVEESEIVKMIASFTPDKYNVYDDHKSLTEGGRKLVDELHHLSQQDGRPIDVDEISKDYKNFKVTPITACFKQTNIGALTEETNKAIEATAFILNKQVESAPVQYKDKAAELIKAAIDVLRDHLGLIVQVSRMMAIIIREMLNIMKLSEVFQTKFAKEMTQLNNAKDFHQAVAATHGS